LRPSRWAGRLDLRSIARLANGIFRIIANGGRKACPGSLLESFAPRNGEASSLEPAVVLTTANMIRYDIETIFPVAMSSDRAGPRQSEGNPELMLPPNHLKVRPSL